MNQDKQKIRDRYKGIDTSRLQVIPAKVESEALDINTPKRVAAYVRVSTDNDEQTSSYELQKNYYTEYITSHPNWELVDIYSDEGISGTSLDHREGMKRMIEDCKAGKIDLILTKSIARFARNIVDCLSVIETLKNLNPPVGVQFESDNIYTLDTNGRMILTVLASVAEEESRSKSAIMNWSIDKRFSRGLFLTPKLLGYDVDENGDLIVNKEESETVKVIYYLYINGYSLKDISSLLTNYNRKTKLGNTKWSPSGLLDVISNERHYGAIRARKTYTPNFLNHKSKKNNGNRNQYYLDDHHEAIISKEVYEAANKLKASLAYSRRNKPVPTLSVIDKGILKGYVPIDKDYTGFSINEVNKASSSVKSNNKPIKSKQGLDLTGYEIVRSNYFSTYQKPALSIDSGKLRFNTACLKKFINTEYIEILVNTVDKKLAIRPANKDSQYSIHWGRLVDSKWQVSTVGCKGLYGMLKDYMNLDSDVRYRFYGEFKEDYKSKMLVFDLEEYEMVKQEEIILKDQEEPSKHNITLYPPFKTTFGRSATFVSEVPLSNNWDILRPAIEVEYEGLHIKDLQLFLIEANNIIKRWA